MVTVLHESEQVRVPGWVSDLSSFRRWSDSDDFPDDYRIWWLCGEVWIDMSKEQIFTHALVKGRISRVLDTLAEEERLGIFLPDGVLLSNFAADFSGNPDGLFLSADTLASDRVRLIEGKEGGYVELQGAPDMVLEVLSNSSEQKDNVTLKRAYHEAGVREYWLVDVRREPIVFEFHRHTARGYVRTAKQQGWVRSSVFGRSFRLRVCEGVQGHPNYALDVR